MNRSERIIFETPYNDEGCFNCRFHGNEMPEEYGCSYKCEVHQCNVWAGSWCEDWEKIKSE